MSLRHYSRHTGCSWSDRQHTWARRPPCMSARHWWRTPSSWRCRRHPSASRRCSRRNRCPSRPASGPGSSPRRGSWTDCPRTRCPTTGRTSAPSSSRWPAMPAEDRPPGRRSSYRNLGGEKKLIQISIHN